jgi:hypothetical protein
MCSLASAKGPSVIIPSPLLAASTTVAVSTGSRPPPKTQIPASTAFLLNASTSWNICCMTSGAGAS